MKQQREVITICDICERPYKSSRISPFICDDCLKKLNNFANNSSLYCNECMSEINKNEPYHIDDSGFIYCDACFSYSGSSSILPHRRKKFPLFYGDKSTMNFYGVELEADGGGKSNPKASKLLKLINNEQELIYIKSDNSLSKGIEIVTHPATLQFHQNDMPWEEITNSLKNMHYKSYKTSTCGLHIHINRTAFGNTEIERLPNLLRFVCVFERFWPELLQFSGRTSEEADKWASRYGIYNSPSQLLSKIQEDNTRNRCVNLRKQTTVEVRLFHGTLNPQFILAAIELVDYIRSISVSTTFSNILNLSWPVLLNGLTDSYPNLLACLKIAGMYKNDPVDTRIDI